MSHGTRLFSYEDRDEIARLTAALDAAHTDDTIKRAAELAVRYNCAIEISVGPYGTARVRATRDGTMADVGAALGAVGDALEAIARKLAGPSPSSPDPTRKQIEAYLRQSPPWECDGGCWHYGPDSYEASFCLDEPAPLVVGKIATAEGRTPAEAATRIAAPPSPTITACPFCAAEGPGGYACDHTSPKPSRTSDPG